MHPWVDDPQRIIPTYVGSTPAQCKHHVFLSNHSHVCGINKNLCLCFISSTRIIPTYVGSTASHSKRSTFETNHSHVCGINEGFAASSASLIESFPRMWDQLLFPLKKNRILRIIPTYVGSTLQIAFTLHQAIQHLVVLCYWRMVYDFLDPQYVLALNSS